MHVRQQFPDLFLVDMLPALDAIIFNEFEQFPTQYTEVFEVKESTRDIEQHTQLSGVGLVPQVAEGSPVTYDNMVQGFDTTYQHNQFGLGVKFSKVMAMNDEHGIMRKATAELARSIKESNEIRVAAHFNNAFSGGPTGPDGVSLVNASHPLPKAGGVQSNVLAVAADVSHSSVQIALTQYRKQVDFAGKKVRIKPRLLVGPPDIEFSMAEAIGGAMRPDTANNTPNALKRRSGFGSFDNYFVWDYLTDTNAWFIVGEKSRMQLNYFWREKPNTVHDIDFDTRTIKTAVWYQNSHGWSDFYGVLGTPGSS